MTRVLHRLSRSACPPADRPWVDALFAELDTIESGRARLAWLLGATGLLADRYARRCFRLLTPANGLCFAATLVFGTMAVTEYQGLAPEDDWYAILAAIFAAGLISVSVLNLRRQSAEVRL